MGESSELTAKQKQFCEEYIIDLNGAQAAIRAGYSEKTAKQTASENLTKPNIQEYLRELQQKRQKRTAINQDYVLNKLQKVAEICTTPNNKGCIDSSGATKALELLGKHFAMFTDVVKGKHDHTVKNAPVIKFNGPGDS